METIDDNQNKEFAKLCKNGCGKLIKWDKSKKFYFEIETNERHKCPNWVPNQRQPPLSLSRKITKEQLLYMDTIGPAISRILSVVENVERHIVQEMKGERTREDVY
jgi:hypothetical protein